MEICSGIICASLVPVKPLVKLLVPFFVEKSQMIASGVRKVRSRASAQVFRTKEMTSLKLDPYAHLANSPTCAGKSDDTVERGEGTIPNDVVIVES